MKQREQPLESQRGELLREIEQLARRALLGTVSETYRTCGTPGCRCHHGGPKHGPHLYVSYRGPKGKTTGYYVAQAIHAEVRAGIDAWNQLQEHLRKIAQLNKERLTAKASRKKATFATGSTEHLASVLMNTGWKPGWQAGSLPHYFANRSSIPTAKSWRFASASLASGGVIFVVDKLSAQV